MASALQKSLSLCLFLLLFRYFVSFSSTELSHRRLNPQLELVRRYKLGAGRRSQENIYKVHILLCSKNYNWPFFGKKTFQVYLTIIAIKAVTQTPCPANQIPNSDKIILLYKRKISFLQDFQFNFIFQNKWKTFKIEEDFLIGLYSLRWWSLKILGFLNPSTQYYFYFNLLVFFATLTKPPKKLNVETSCLVKMLQRILKCEYASRCE